MIASKRGHLAVVKSLIEEGADVNQTDKVSKGTEELMSSILSTTACIPGVEIE